MNQVDQKQQQQQNQEQKPAQTSNKACAGDEAIQKIQDARDKKVGIKLREFRKDLPDGSCYYYGKSSDNKFHFTAFNGKSKKPLFIYTFKNESDAQLALKKYLKSVNK